MRRLTKWGMLALIALANDAPPIAPAPCFSLYVTQVPTHLDTHVKYRSLDGTVHGYMRIGPRSGPARLIETPIRAAKVCGRDASHRFEVLAWVDTTGESPIRCSSPSSDECAPDLEDPTRAKVTDAGATRIVLSLPSQRILG